MEKNSKLPVQNFKQMMDKLKNLKKDQLLILLLVGILLVVIAIPTKKKEEKDQGKESSSVVTNQNGDTETGEDTLDILEEKLKRALSKVEGVGEVEVMITMKSKGEKIIGKDTPSITKSQMETDSQGGTRSSNEVNTSESTIYAQDENGKQVPYITEELEPKVEGVIVIAKGGDDPVVIKNISEAIMALFKVEAHKIKIMKMN